MSLRLGSQSIQLSASDGGRGPVLKSKSAGSDKALQDIWGHKQIRKHNIIRDRILLRRPWVCLDIFKRKDRFRTRGLKLQLPRDNTRNLQICLRTFLGSSKMNGHVGYANVFIYLFLNIYLFACVGSQLWHTTPRARGLCSCGARA